MILEGWLPPLTQFKSSALKNRERWRSDNLLGFSVSRAKWGSHVCKSPITTVTNVHTLVALKQHKLIFLQLQRPNVKEGSAGLCSFCGLLGRSHFLDNVSFRGCSHSLIHRPCSLLPLLPSFSLLLRLWAPHLPLIRTLGLQWTTWMIQDNSSSQDP